MQSTTEPCPPDARVSMVVYGEEGKTGEIVLQPSTVGRHSKLKRNRSSQSRARDSVSLMDCFKPNKTDEFKVNGIASLSFLGVVRIIIFMENQ